MDPIMAMTSSPHRNSISDILRSLSETLFWGIAAVGLSLLSLSSVLQLLQLPSQTFAIFLFLRLVLLGFALAALSWRSVGRELARTTAASMMIIVMSERVFELGWLGPDAVSVGSLDSTALLFLVAGAVYRGQSRRWWTVLMPWAILNQLMLLMELSQKSGSKLNDLAQASLITSIAFAGTCVFFAIRSARVVESQEIFDRSVEAVTSLKEVQAEIKVLVGLLTAKEQTQATPFAGALNGAAFVAPTAPTATSIEATPNTTPNTTPDETLARTSFDLSNAVDELAPLLFNVRAKDLEVQAIPTHGWQQVALHYPLPSEVPEDELMDPVDVFEILKETVSRQGEAIQKAWDKTKARERGFKSQTRLTLNAPTESAWPIVIRAHREFLRSAFHSLLLRAIESANSSGQGVVRVNFRVGLSLLSITFEDNGRGFSEEKLRALSFPDTYLATDSSVQSLRPAFLGVSEIRDVLEQTGNMFDFQARLGVGTRAIMDFPRLDAYSSETIRSSKNFTREIETRRL